MDVCRICFEGDGEPGKLLSPCACRGSASLIHEACLRKWCRRSGNYISCDLCHQSFVGPAAVALAQDAMGLANQLKGVDVVKMKTAHHLAKTLDESGKHLESVAQHRRNLATYQLRLGESHPDTLSILSSLAHALNKIGQNEEALSLHRKAFSGMKAARGEDHLNTLTVGNNLAIALCDAGHPEESVHIFRQVLEGRTRTLGDGHKDTLNAASNLAGALSKCGRYDEVMDLYRKSHSALSRLLGEEHPNTLTIASNLAVALSNGGYYAEAATHQRKTFDARQRALGREHPASQEAARFLNLLEAKCTENVLKSAICGADSAGGASISQAGGASISQEEALLETCSGRRAGAPETSATRTDERAARVCGKRTREESADEVLAVLLQVDIPFEQAQSYVERLMADGFDSLPALRTLRPTDFPRLAIRACHGQSILDFLASRA